MEESSSERMIQNPNPDPDPDPANHQNQIRRKTHPVKRFELRWWQINTQTNGGTNINKADFTKKKPKFMIEKHLFDKSIFRLVGDN